jgi:hypothetical protein
LFPFYSPIGCPSIDPALMIRMRPTGYCMGIRSERRLREEVHLNLAYDGEVIHWSRARPGVRGRCAADYPV